MSNVRALQHLRAQIGRTTCPATERPASDSTHARNVRKMLSAKLLRALTPLLPGNPKDNPSKSASSPRVPRARPHPRATTAHKSDTPQPGRGDSAHLRANQRDQAHPSETQRAADTPCFAHLSETHSNRKETAKA